MKNKVWEFIKSLGSYYDYNTDKIHGCKKGSWVYIHEQGHKTQRKFILITRLFPEFLMLYIIASLVFQNYETARICFILYAGYFVGLEIDAWAYVFWVWRTKNKR